MSRPRWGRTRDGQPVHAHVRDHLPSATSVQRVNSWLAVRVTAVVGSMFCAYAFAAIALVSLPSALASGSVIVIVSWVAQTFLQLVLLSVIIVGQSIQAVASDARAAKTFEDTERIICDLAEVLAAVGEARQDYARTIQAISGATGGKT